MTDVSTEAPVAPSGGPPPGWYPDPAGPGRSRWWSGEGWTDHVQEAAPAAPVAPVVPVAPIASVAPVAPAAPVTPVPLAGAPAAAPATALASASATASSNLGENGVPLVLFADSVVAPEALSPVSRGPETQEDWHGSVGRGPVVKRQGAGSVSLSTTVSSDRHDPYRARNWAAGLAIALALLGIPALGWRTLTELPALTQSIFAGAPIAVSLLALAIAVRRGGGLVLSIVAVLISGVVLLAGLLIDPETLRSATQSVLGLIGG
ncbi:MAG: DUF2510 domain-containing protein [Microbacteriaceae bacterium]|nr:DUF2510 domain-containing protein [Microbacteriaceae bacterium]